MANSVLWCARTLSILKWLQILCSLVVVVLLADGRIQWGFYTVIYVGVLMLVVFTALTLLLYYFDVHRGSDTLPWTPIELSFNTLAAVFLFICVAVGVYDCVKMYGMYDQPWDHHPYAPPVNIGKEGWRSRMAAITAVLAINAALYMVSACRTARVGIA